MNYIIFNLVNPNSKRFDIKCFCIESASDRKHFVLNSIACETYKINIGIYVYFLY